MLISRRQLHALSRDPATLVRAILVILGVFFLNAVWLGYLRPQDPPREKLEDPWAMAVRPVLKSTPLDRAALLRALREEVQAARRFGADTEDTHGNAPELPPDPAPQGHPAPSPTSGTQFTCLNVLLLVLVYLRYRTTRTALMRELSSHR